MHNRERNLSNIRLASDEPDLTEEEEKGFYNERGIRTKSQLLKEILNTKARLTNFKDESRKKCQAYYSRLAGLIDRFYRDVESMFLMEVLSDWWGYGFTIKETGIILKLEHLVVMYDDNITLENPNAEKHFLMEDESFTIHETKAELLSLDEYGNIYNVPGDTVRQWIRRGKIRSAVKFGNDWRIPELVDRPQRGYTPGHYVWDEEIPNPPEEIPDINDFNSLSIQPSKETGVWVAMLNSYDKQGESDGRAMTGKMKEKLEVYLISHPLVECINNFLGEVHQMSIDDDSE